MDQHHHQQQQQQQHDLCQQKDTIEAHAASLLALFPTSSSSASFPLDIPPPAPRASCSPSESDQVKRGKHRRCQAPGCNTQCNFGFPSSRAEFCFAHKLGGQINVSHRLCQEPECRRLAAFSFVGEKVKLCGTHKLEGMQSRRKRPSCQHLGCSRQPVFGYSGQPRKACAAHKAVGMKSKTVVRLCRGAGCGKSAGFGFPSPGGRADYCVEHRVDGMVCLRARSCEAPEGCSRRACFSFGPGTVATLCGPHQQPGMVNTKRKVCDEAGCTRAALSGGDGDQGKMRRCRQHSSPAGTATNSSTTPPHITTLRSEAFLHSPPAVPETTPQPQLQPQQPRSSSSRARARDPGHGSPSSVAAAAAMTATAVNDSRCEHPGCWRDPVFAGHADPGKWPRFCSVHRMDAIVDASFVRCNDGNCEATASWGYFRGQAARCGAHRHPQMIDVKARRCRREGCSRVPYFAPVSSMAEGAAWCSLHQTEGMLDVKSQRCSVEGCENTPLDSCRSEDLSSTCREHGSTWSPAVETGFPSSITDADTAEAATVVASLWADAIGGDLGMGGGSSGGGGGGGGVEEGRWIVGTGEGEGGGVFEEGGSSGRV